MCIRDRVSTDHVNVFPEGKSPVSLAFLNEQNDAEYLFYKDYPRLRLDVTCLLYTSVTLQQHFCDTGSSAKVTVNLERRMGIP